MKEAAEVRAAAHEKGTRGVRTAAATIGAASAVVAAIPPFGPIAAVIGGSIALGLTIAAAVRDGEDKVLRGDSSVIAGYIKKVAKWDRAKRKKEAEKLLVKYQKHTEKGEKKYLLTKKKYKDTDAWRIAHKKLKMKLLALHVSEVTARAFPNSPKVKGDPRTSPAAEGSYRDDGSNLEDAQAEIIGAGVDATPLPEATATTAIPWTPILAAAGVAGVLLIVATRPKPAAPAYPPDERGGKGGARA